MPTLQIRDLPQGIYDRLVLEAGLEHRSLAQQATAILDSHFRQMGTAGAAPGPAYDDTRLAQARASRRARVFDDIDRLAKGWTWPDDEACLRLMDESRSERNDRLGL